MGTTNYVGLLARPLEFVKASTELVSFVLW